MDPLRDIAMAQVERARQLRHRTTTELQLLLHRALSPDAVRKALLKERPVLEALRTLDLQGPDPAQMREEACAVGLLDATREDLDLRRLYPALDLGVYCANHAVGKPSEATRLALDQFYAQHAILGVDAFMEAGWIDLFEDTKVQVGELCGDLALQHGDVVFFPNLSDALSAVLAPLRGRLVTTAGHFTTGHYIHEHWAHRTGGQVVVVPEDEQECIPTERILEALTPETTVVSLSQVHWRSGWVHDLDAIAAAMAETCPGAALLLDVYQGHGTVPVDRARLPARTAVLGGALKQLKGGTGGGYAWISRELLADLEADRTGWWAHAEPLAFEPPPLRPADGAARLQTGSPALLPVVLLATELKVLAASGPEGSLLSGVERARRVTRDLVARAVDRCLARGLQVRGPVEPERRGAFFAVAVEGGPGLLAALSAAGVTADFRADAPGGEAGLLRLSASSAHFAYELDYAVDVLAAALGR
jgi:kynureninase